MRRITTAIWVIGISLVLVLSSFGCSLTDRLGKQTSKEWSISLAGLQKLIDETNQGMSEPDRILNTIDRVDIPQTGGLKVSGSCQNSDGSTQEGDFSIALINQDSRVRMEITPGNTCGVGREDPRLSVTSDKLSNALGEKIAADCGKVLVTWIELSGKRLTVRYVEQ